DVVDEDEHVAAFVAEVLGHGQAGERDAETGSRRLVHLAEDQGSLVTNARFLELAPERGALTGTLAHAAEHRVATELGGDVADELGDDNGLADAGAAEDADLTALGERGDEVDDLRAGLEHFDRGRLVL